MQEFHGFPSQSCLTPETFDMNHPAEGNRRSRSFRRSRRDDALYEDLTTPHSAECEGEAPAVTWHEAYLLNAI